MPLGKGQRFGRRLAALAQRARDSLFPKASFYQIMTI